MNELNSRLKIIRARVGLTQREAARRIGVSESTYRAWEYGNAIQGEPYSQIAKAFNIRLDELFGISNEESIEEKLDRIISELQCLKSILNK